MLVPIIVIDDNDKVVVVVVVVVVADVVVVLVVVLGPAGWQTLLIQHVKWHQVELQETQLLL